MSLQARDLLHTAQAGLAPGERLRVGIDTVSVASMAESLGHFGQAFSRRLFTAAECQAAERVPGHEAERYAARFAVKEAVIKALDLAEVGIDWRHIELCGAEAARPWLQLHGPVAACAAAAGVGEWSVSISHDGPSACAVVVALCPAPTPCAGSHAGLPPCSPAGPSLPCPCNLPESTA